MPQLKVVSPEPITIQARRAIAEYRAERNGQRRLSDEEIAKLDDLTAIETINGEIVIDHHEWRGQFSWQNVFDSKAGFNLAGAARSARESNYRFFAHEGRVFFVSCRGAIEDTGLLVSEIS